MSLQKVYDSLLQKHNLDIVECQKNISTALRDIINDYMAAHKRVALYCYGAHTRALMAEYIFELRDIVCIIDNGDIEAKKQGYAVIKDEEIDSMNLDGVIISSYLYRDEIKDILRDRHKHLDFLDLYDALNKHGIPMKYEFFRASVPKQIYYEINQMYQKLKQETNICEILKNLIKKYIEIKDFRLAAQAAGALYEVSNDENDRLLQKDLEGLYESVLDVLKKQKDAVFLLCVDGLKAEEVSEKGRLQKTYAAIKQKATIFTRAYSYSSSTFESLVPVFSETYDCDKRELLEVTTVPLKNCRFAKFAQEHGRKIYVYGGGIKYIEDSQIKYIEHPQTIAQMFWSFVNDLEKDPNGLFYMQPVSESHFTFPSPYYTRNDMVFDDMSLFYNYLSTKGENLKIKYSLQYQAAIKYVDDTLEPILGAIACRTALFADHGDYDYEEVENNRLEDIPPNHLTTREELFRIPMVLISPEEGGTNDAEISLAELNNIAISMMTKNKFDYKGKPYIKIGRTAIYNADCKYIFRHILHSEHNLCAFEGFIFDDGYKLVVFSDGTRELYTTKGDCLIENDELMEAHYRMIKAEIEFADK